MTSLVTLERDDDTMLLRCPLTLNERAKEIPGVRWDRDVRAWRLPLSWAQCVIARGVFGDELQVGPLLTQWSWQEHQERVAPAMAAREAKE